LKNQFENQGTFGKYHENYEGFVILASYTIIEPFTMVIKLMYAFIARLAMF
jgi:hypothetical protein